MDVVPDVVHSDCPLDLVRSSGLNVEHAMQLRFRGAIFASLPRAPDLGPLLTRCLCIILAGIRANYEWDPSTERAPVVSQDGHAWWIVFLCLPSLLMRKPAAIGRAGGSIAALVRSNMIQFVRGDWGPLFSAMVTAAEASAVIQEPVDEAMFSPVAGDSCLEASTLPHDVRKAQLCVRYGELSKGMKQLSQRGAPLPLTMDVLDQFTAKCTTDGVEGRHARAIVVEDVLPPSKWNPTLFTVDAVLAAIRQVSHTASPDLFGWSISTWERVAYSVGGDLVVTSFNNLVAVPRMVPADLSRFLYGAPGVPLRKPDGSVRPIGNCCMVVKVCHRCASNESKLAANSYVTPYNLGLASGGAQLGALYTWLLLTEDPSRVLLQRDARNAFNLTARDAAVRAMTKAGLPRLAQPFAAANASLVSLVLKDPAESLHFVDLSDGIIQGASLSAQAYTLVAAAVSRHLADAGKHAAEMCTVGYADDSTSVTAIQRVVDALRYSVDLQLTFNSMCTGGVLNMDKHVAFCPSMTDDALADALDLVAHGLSVDDVMRGVILRSVAAHRGVPSADGECNGDDISDVPVAATNDEVTILRHMRFTIRGGRSTHTCVLGSPFGESSVVQKYLIEELHDLRQVVQAIAALPQVIDRLHLLRYCANTKYVHLARTLPPSELQDFAVKHDLIIREGLAAILAPFSQLTDEAYYAATLPIKLTGLGLTRLQDILAPAFVGCLVDLARSANQLFSDPAVVQRMLDSAADSKFKAVHDAVVAVNKFLPDDLAVRLPELGQRSAKFQKVIMQHVHRRRFDEFFQKRSPERQKMVHALCQDTTWYWLRTTSIDSHLAIPNWVARFGLLVRLGLPVADLSLLGRCTCKRDEDVDEMHLFRCHQGHGTIARHNAIVAELRVMAGQCGLAHAYEEPRGFADGHQGGPDILFYGLYGAGADALADVTVVDAMKARSLNGRFDAAVAAASLEKTAKYSPGDRSWGALYTARF
jgi:hypothetical protein